MGILSITLRISLKHMPYRFFQWNKYGSHNYHPKSTRTYVLHIPQGVKEVHKSNLKGHSTFVARFKEKPSNLDNKTAALIVPKLRYIEGGGFEAIPSWCDLRKSSRAKITKLHSMYGNLTDSMFGNLTAKKILYFGTLGLEVHKS